MARFGSSWLVNLKLWLVMARYGSNYGSLWFVLARYGTLWRVLARHGLLWLKLGLIMACYGSLGLVLARYGSMGQVLNENKCNEITFLSHTHFSRPLHKTQLSTLPCNHGPKIHTLCNNTSVPAWMRTRRLFPSIYRPRLKSTKTVLS